MQAYPPKPNVLDCLDLSSAIAVEQGKREDHMFAWFATFCLHFPMKVHYGESRHILRRPRSSRPRLEAVKFDSHWTAPRSSPQKNSTGYLNTTQILLFKGFHLKRESPQGNLRQEAYRRHPVLHRTAPRSSPSSRRRPSATRSTFAADSGAVGGRLRLRPTARQEFNANFRSP